MSTPVVTMQSSMLETILELSATNVDAMLSSFPVTGPMSHSPSANSLAVASALENESSISNVLVQEHHAHRKYDTLLRLTAFVAALGLLAAMSLVAVFL